jgi:hypothetical protein
MKKHLIWGGRIFKDCCKVFTKDAYNLNTQLLEV